MAPHHRVSGKDVAEYLGARSLGAVLRAMGPDGASAAMGAAFAALMPRTARHARALSHLALALPDLADGAREALALAMWRHLGRVAGEAFQIDRLVADPARMAMPADFPELTALVRRGCVAASLHLGNWEIAGTIPARTGLSVAGVYQALHNPLSDAYFKRMRGNVFTAGMYPKGPDLGRTLIRLARGGAGIGIASDLREKRGIGITFFGRPAYATPLPAMLSRLTGRPLMAGAAIRTEGARFTALVEEVPVATTSDRDGDIAAATQALHAVFERWIRAHPEQWLWTHRKWARSGEREIVIAPGAAGVPKALPRGVAPARQTGG